MAHRVRQRIRFDHLERADAAPVPGQRDTLWRAECGQAVTHAPREDTPEAPTTYESLHLPWQSEDVTVDSTRNKLHVSHYPVHFAPLMSLTSTKVLKLHPGMYSDPLHCSLLVRDLSTHSAPYEAISYVWGNEAPTCELTLHGDRPGDVMQILIRPNVEAALRQLRHRSVSRDVWVDAICINQHDLVERGQQVNLMGAVFSTASRVLVWLGPDDLEYAQDSFRTVKLLASSIRDKIGPRGSPEAVQFSDIIDTFGFRQWIERGPTIARVFDLDWFYRLWCVQELVLSRQAIFLWGSEEVDWVDVSCVTAALVSQGQHFLDLESMPSVCNAYFLRNLHSPDDHAPRLSLLRMLSLTRQYEVTEERDRVYSLLGLVTHPERLDAAPSTLAADYSMSLRQLYFEVAETTIQQDNNLLTLSCVQNNDPRGSLNSPSWVPQWHDSTVQTLTPFDAIARKPEAIQAPLGSIGIFPDVLQCEGVILDTVLGYTGVFDSSDTGCPSHIHALRAAWGCIRELSRQVSHREPYASYAVIAQLARGRYTVKAFCRALLGRNELASDLPGRDPMVDLLLHDREAHVDGRGLNHECITQRSSFCPVLPAACHGRRVYITEKGFIGLGPAALQRGDHICRLVGAAVPMILRKHDNHFYLVGETYVDHGVDTIAQYRDKQRGKLHAWRQEHTSLLALERAKPENFAAPFDGDANTSVSQRRKKVSNRLASLSYST